MIIDPEMAKRWPAPDRVAHLPGLKFLSNLEVSVSHYPRGFITNKGNDLVSQVHSQAGPSVPRRRPLRSQSFMPNDYSFDAAPFTQPKYRSIPSIRVANLTSSMPTLMPNRPTNSRKSESEALPRLNE